MKRVGYLLFYLFCEVCIGCCYFLILISIASIFVVYVKVIH
jgi:hypothetical protein